MMQFVPFGKCNAAFSKLQQNTVIVLRSIQDRPGIEAVLENTMECTFTQRSKNCSESTIWSR